MNVMALTHPDAFCLQAQFASREEVIHELARRLAALGKISDSEQFLADVFARENDGPTALGEGLADDATRDAVRRAASAQQLLNALALPSHAEPVTTRFADAPVVVCVTACPAGIAHTYMAAEYLEKAGQQLGVNVCVERQGANGIESRLTAAQLKTARACIFAADVAIKESERFTGIPSLSVPVAEPIRHAQALIQQALALTPSAEARQTQAVSPLRVSVKTELKQALLSGISFAVPLIVAGGTVLAVAVLLAQMLGLQHLFDLENSWLWMYRKLGGGMLGTLMVPVLAAYTAYSLADKPALAPGFAAGLAANMIGSGFLGAVAGGLIAGYLMRWVKTHLRLSNRFNGFLTYYLYPVLGTLGAGSLMLFVVGEPVAWINNGLTAWLNGLSGANALLLGAIIGFMCSFDLGGPVNKAAYAFCLGAMANGVYGPYAIFASVKMVSAFTVTASTMLAPHLFKTFEIETGKSTWLLGLAGITEGAIPMAIEDPLRVIGSFVLGSMVTGSIVGAMSLGLSTPGAGIFSLFLLHDGGLGKTAAAAGWFAAALVGTLISTCVLILWRRYAVKTGKYVTDRAIS